MKKVIIPTFCLIVSFCANAALLDRVKSQADAMAVAYGETWNSFYGDGKYKMLMKASMDVRPDGTPNIILDEAAGKMTVTIRLAVNEGNYAAWAKAAHERFAATKMSFRFSEFEDPEGRMIAGKNYRFGENEEASIKRWENAPGNGYKAKLTIRVRLVDGKGKVLHERYIPLEQFQRLGYASYPIPLHNLNRLLDLPRGRFKWFDSDKEPKSDDHVEDAYTKISYFGVTSSVMSSLEDVVCDILDEVDMKPVRPMWAEQERKEREARERMEREEREAREIAARKMVISKLLNDMISVPGKDFKMGKTEVTQAQWEAVMGENPSRFKGTDRPVENVSWNDCQEFIKKLNELREVKSAKIMFRLPTEEEWEYVCRAGSTGDWGKRKNGEEGPLDVMGWYCDNSGEETHPVAQKEPNAFGFYDMHGNVWEWTSTSVGGSRVIRGGGWSIYSRYCSAGNRFWNCPDRRSNDLGFRLVAQDL